MKYDCKATHCPDRTGKLEDFCKRCSTYLDRDKDCPWLCCESYPEECNKDSIYCKRCERYKTCYIE